ncbi:MAG: CocE/NonD family hydrolase, partial [Terracidiphilus sp.]
MIRLRPELPCVALLLASALLLLRPPCSIAQPPPTTPESLAGEFTDPSGQQPSCSVYLQNGQLTIESSRLVPTELRPFSATVFSLSGTEAIATFSFDAMGKVTSVALSSYPNIVFVLSGPPVHHVFHDYVRTEAMIPMRDGVKLHAVILTPADIHTPLPILMQRTPYGVDDTSRAWFFEARPQLARDGYIYVGEDIRGRYRSEGKFVMMRPLADHREAHAIDESTDASDTVAWLVKNLPNNSGRVGVVGTSYPGFLAAMAGIDPSPAVKAISPQAPMIDV